MSRDWHDLLAMVSVGILARRLSQIDRWVQAQEILTIRFEEVVGTARGGDDRRRADTARRLAAWFGADEEPLLAAFEADHESRTLRRGQVGAWRDEMPPRSPAVSRASTPS